MESEVIGIGLGGKRVARKKWIQTLEGRVLTPLHVEPEQVDSARAIAHSLAGKNRFTGQTARRYTVAEHCFRGSQLMPTRELAGAFLLHELSEVYLPDISGPLKPSVYVEARERRTDSWARCHTQPPTSTDLVIPIHDGETAEDAARAFLGLVTWEALERQHTSAILKHLGLSHIEPLIYSPEVKHMDWAMLAAEKRDLCVPEPADWKLPHAPAECGTILPWSADFAEVAFFDRYCELFAIP